MESSESHEPSYYEVALTNRQVLIAFVVLLTSIVAAFLSGVWIGRGGSSVARPSPGINAAASVSADAPLEQLTFFSGKEAGSRATGAQATTSPATPTTARPAAVEAQREDSPSAAAESATEAMRQNLDATMAANRTVPVSSTAAASPPAPSAPPAGTRVTTAPPAPPTGASAKPAAANAKAPASTKPPVSGTFVQVYSSTNGARAKEIVAELRKGGFPVAMSETLVNGATNYRVRVGAYGERAKADAAAARLRREYRLETWVTDSP